jgi:hypothetical protein
MVYPALAEDQEIIWTSSDPVGVSVDATGLITTKPSGLMDTVMITATSHEGGFADTCVVFMEPPGNKCAYPDCVPHEVPGEINATWFDKGGEGVGYHDLTAGNAGDGPRQDEDVDTEYRLKEGAIGGIQSGEWLEYTINVKEEGDYTLSILFATTSRYGTFHIEIDGVDVTGIVYVKTSGDFNSLKPTVIENLHLPQGKHILRIAFDFANYNMGTITISGVTATGNLLQPDPSVEIFPNPVKNKLFIKSDVQFERYRIRSLDGRTILQGDLYGDRIINTEPLKRGYYVIVFERRDLIVRKKLVKF